jgi:hypothetical protein
MAEYKLHAVSKYWFISSIIRNMIDGIVPDADTFICATNDDISTNVAAAELLDDDTLSEDDDIGQLGPFEIIWFRKRPSSPINSIILDGNLARLKDLKTLVPLRVIIQFIISLTKLLIIMPYI